MSRLPDLGVRAVRPEDAEAVARVHAEAGQAAFAGLLPPEVLAQFDYPERRAFWRGLLCEAAKRPQVSVAEPLDAGGALAGFVWTRLVDLAPRPPAGEIVAIYVRPAAQRRGVGRALLAEAARSLGAQDAERVYLWVYRDNAQARRFYEALRGRIVDRDVETHGEVRLPTVAYAWRPDDLLAAAGGGAGS